MTVATGEATRMTIEEIGRTGIAAKHETTTEGNISFLFVLSRLYRKDANSNNNYSLDNYLLKI